MGSKKNKRDIKKKGADAKHEAPKNPPPPRHWWNHVTDPQKIIAGAGVLTALLIGAGLYFSNRQYHQQHRPRVIFSRPPQILEPFVCDMAKGSVTIGNSQKWVKNIGDTEAKAVYPYFTISKVIPDKKTGVPEIDNLPQITDSACDTVVAPPAAIALGFPLAPNQELSPQSRGGAMGMFGTKPLGKDASIQLFTSDCVFYRGPDDRDEPHGTCTTYRFIPDNGNPSFKCGSPISGAFQMYLSGHCAN